VRHQFRQRLNTRQQGVIGTTRLVFALTLFAGISLVVLPRYESFVAKSKIQEGFNLASDSKAQLSEFFITRGRFPETESEAASIKTQSLTPPEFVRAIEIDYEDPKNAVMIRMYFKDGVLTSEIGPEDYVYLAGNKSSVPDALIEWTCGGIGIHYKLLPTQCVK